MEIDPVIIMYYNARNTLIKMCEDRNYEVDNKLYSVNINEFMSLFNNNNINIHNGIVDNTDSNNKNIKIYIKFILPFFTSKNEKIVDILNNYCFDNNANDVEEYYNKGKCRLIIILPQQYKYYEKDID